MATKNKVSAPLRMPPELAEKIARAVELTGLAQADILRLALAIGLEDLRKVNYDIPKLVSDAARPHLAGNTPLSVVPTEAKVADEDPRGYRAFKLDLVGGVAAGAQILSDGDEEVLQVEKNYGKNHYALRVFGRSMEPKIPDGSIVVVKRLPDSTKPKKGTIVVYADGHGLSLKVFGYRVAEAGEEGDAFGKVPVLSSINPEFPEIQLMESGRLEAVFVEVLPQD